MEIGGIIDALMDKSILITGSTGFLAKIFVEKVLRVQPKVKRLYLLVRASDAKSAQQRLQSEVIEKELFDVLREKYGDAFPSFIAEKVCPIAGDIIRENLGIGDIETRDLLWKEVNIVVNSAATTNFFGRYDISLSINVLGAMHVMNFAKRCKKLDVFLHVSTAYVTRENKGVLFEKAFMMGETHKSTMYLDIEAEIKLAERKKKELQLQNSTLEVEKMTMKELGINRAQHFGWSNTYVFTKAMSEMLLGKLRGNLPFVIARPAIITSTWKEPFPGWIEGKRTIDSIIVSYAKGNLPCFAVDINAPMDVIPGDMVVNAMIAMAIAHSNQKEEFIYHIGSSIRNPVKYSILQPSLSYCFFENPLVGNNGKELKNRKVLIFNTLVKFRVFMFLRYQLPMMKYNALYRRYKFLMHLVDLYVPFAFFKGCFDDTNLERLRMTTKKLAENHIFYFDPKDIDWDEYFCNIHIPGVVKYLCN